MQIPATKIKRKKFIVIYRHTFAPLFFDIGQVSDDNNEMNRN